MNGKNLKSQSATENSLTATSHKLSTHFDKKKKHKNPIVRKKLLWVLNSQQIYLYQCVPAPSEGDQFERKMESFQ